MQLIGPQHVGLGLDYVFDQKELDDYVRANPEVYPPEKGYGAGMAMVEPERFPAIAEALLRKGYREADVQGSDPGSLCPSDAANHLGRWCQRKSMDWDGPKRGGER